MIIQISGVSRNLRGEYYIVCAMTKLQYKYHNYSTLCVIHALAHRRDSLMAAAAMLRKMQDSRARHVTYTMDRTRRMKYFRDTLVPAHVYFIICVENRACPLYARNIFSHLVFARGIITPR